MTRAVVLCGHDLGVWRARHEVGDSPAALPYEVDALEGFGIEVAPFGVTGGHRVTKLRNVVEHRLGLPVQAALRAAPAVARSDVVVALLEREGALPALLKRRRIPPYSTTPLMIWSCWLADELSRADTQRRQALRDRYSQAELIAHLSQRETETFLESGFSDRQLVPMTYGVSDRYYTPGPEDQRDLELIAVGQDRGRDYATLFSAVEGTDLRVDLVCRPENLHGLRVPANVRVHGPVPHAEYREMLRRAKVMAVPTHVLAYPTGSSVALEASASGCCVIATDTPAMSDYISHGVSGLLVPHGDPGAWRETLLRLRADDALRRRLGEGARRSVETTFNARNMWGGLADALRQRGLV